MATVPGIRPGIYEIDYFSSSQVALYIADVLVDEVTSLAFNVQQSRKPLYGYADTFFSAVSKGQVLVQGQFTINFKEAGYLYLVLQNNNRLFNPFGFILDDKGKPVQGRQEDTYKRNIEQIVNGEVDPAVRFEAIQNLQEAYASLGGFASTARAAEDSWGVEEHGKAAKKGGGDRKTTRTDLGAAENTFEAFENAIWKEPIDTLLNADRRCDDTRLNPFDIYVTYGDFTGDDTHNHTIVRLNDVYIYGSAQQIEMDNMPIQEMYSFFARTKI